LKTRLNQLESSVWFYMLFLAGVLTIPLRHFIPPDCTQAVTGPFGLELVFNCDSAQFMQDSQTPERLVQADTSYQDRPLYSMTSHYISILLGLVISGGRSFTNSSGEIIEFRFANLVAFWIIHLVTLLVALYLLIHFLKQSPELVVVSKFAIVSLFFLNDVTKGFFWTPHTQVFSIFLIAYGLFSWQKFTCVTLSIRFKILWFFSSSLLIFFYPILVLALVIPVLSNFRRNTIPSVLAVLPYLIYPHILRLAGGKYRNPQVEDFNQFVWVLDSEVLSLMTENFKLYLISLSFPHVIVLVSVLALYVLAVRRKRRESFIVNERSYIVLYGFILSYALFLYFMGLYATRLSIPFLSLMISIMILHISKKCSTQIQVVASSMCLVFALVSFFFTQGTIS